MAASSPDKTSAKDMSAKDTSADDQSADDTARATAALDRLAALHPKLIDLGLTRTFDPVSYTHLTLPTNREV